MSEFHVEVFRVGEVTKHPDADTLSIVYALSEHGDGYPVIFRTGQFKEGDLAVYIPVDAIVDGDRPEFSFLGAGKKHRIKAKRLRGVYSQGLLTEVPPREFSPRGVGDNVQEVLGIEKWEPAIDLNQFKGPQVPPPPGAHIPVYDLEGLRKFGKLLREGEEVVLTEKIHGSNVRFFFNSVDQKMYVGSRQTWKEEVPGCVFWNAVKAAGVTQEKLEAFPDFVFYGEVFGPVQDLKYGHPGKDSAPAFLRCFDVYWRGGRGDVLPRFLSYSAAKAMMEYIGVTPVPVFYRGSWDPKLVEMAEGESTFASHVREGFVVRPLVERGKVGNTPRACLKCVGEGYHLRKTK